MSFFNFKSFDNIVSFTIQNAFYVYDPLLVNIPLNTPKCYQ